MRSCFLRSRKRRPPSATSGVSGLAGVRERLDAGELPLSNADVFPLVGGAMTPSFMNGPAMQRFATRMLPAYQELDRYGRIAHDWAQLLAGRARAERRRRR